MLKLIASISLCLAYVIGFLPWWINYCGQFSEVRGLQLWMLGCVGATVPVGMAVYSAFRVATEGKKNQ